ncbi:hypothetical protein [Gillisia sp. JM1]|uniref:hypothetical protein n=1 Tax=Gillisia sp. JM1 TaxID=1283286 RepID=UPI00041FBD48|nr:hypothetical protein [Gillisia sp. JM1]
MKFYTSLLLLSSIFIIISCSKDDPELNRGEIIFENNSYELNKGYINFRGDPDFNMFGIHLSNDNTTFTENGKEFGKNSTTTIDLIFFNEKDSISEINNYYPLRYSSITDEILTTEAQYLIGSAINFNLSQKDGNWNANPRIYNWNDGSATIENISGIYKISFILEYEGNIITGNYIGSLETVEYF